jgi:hypothetical protein
VQPAPEVCRESRPRSLLEDELDHAPVGASAQDPTTATAPRGRRRGPRAPPDDPAGQALRAKPDDPAGQALRAMRGDAPPLLLSKFRGAVPVRVEAAPPRENQPVPVPAKPAAAVRGRATLGRVRPLRRHAVDPDAPPKVDPLVRLLADF